MYKTSLVITTINKANYILRKYAKNCKKNNWEFIVVGDKKTPKDFKLKNCLFVNYKKKIKKLKFVQNCHTNSYTRKNIGYLISIKKNVDFIVETDDDNLPLNNFFKPIKHFEKAKILSKKNDWLNIYNYFLKNNLKIWPRGLPLNKINHFSNKNIKKARTLPISVIQSVCNGNPDVDAIFRLINKNEKNVKFIPNLKYFLDINTFCPFNSQSTTWTKECFPLLYLPSYCSMRTTDIWRSLVAQIILYNNNKKILFVSPTVYQIRNEHNLLSDFKSEIPIYLENNVIIQLLKDLNLKKGADNYIDNLVKCYELLVKKNFLPKKELNLLSYWIQDLNFMAKTAK